jgi:ubiquinone/menaquinone biosynthesis C-methylase UbiE
MKNTVKGYFDKAVNDFDAIYEGKGAFGKWIDLRFRRDMYERYRLTFETCGDVNGQTILDIGCGSGRYAVEFGRRHADHVVGMDLAPNMIMAARKLAEEQGVSDNCNFIVGDFMQMEFKQQFNICVAIGVFDYIVRPRPFLEKMRTLSKKWLIMSFPSISVIRTPIRKIRYWFKNCPVYFYDRNSIEKLIYRLGEYQIVKIPGQGMDYFVSIKVL